MVIDAACNDRRLLRRRTTQQKLHITRNAEVVPVGIQRSQELNVGYGGIHQRYDSRHDPVPFLSQIESDRITSSSSFVCSLFQRLDIGISQHDTLCFYTVVAS
ncbi:TPA: hypothetical protein VDA67_000527 [Burkholderia vietnamiensis]|nr:hypothetical protein [Burkholderia vietnamiensis]HEP6282221.1 hypothetical protein [Burkholderia vietnamiensis]HEP6307203.1 hypothetical protein [Burkholderia vietnamiensis]